MKGIITRVLTLGVIASTIVAPASPGPSASTADEILVWAEQRFEAAGLSMPVVDIRRHADKAACDGNSALWRASDSGGVIEFCVDPDSEVAEHRIILHELAHAWTDHNVTTDLRDAFLESRGLEHWRDPAPWELRGSEHAAEIIAWGLMDRELLVYTITPNDTESLTAGFVLLTGQTPPDRG
jgi:hypothetical protein